MNKAFGLLGLFGVLGAALAGCGLAPEATESPPTQTPWIVVVTATSQSGEVVEALPTQARTGTIAAPTRAAKASAAPTKAATPRSGATTEPTAVPAEPTVAEASPAVIEASPAATEASPAATKASPGTESPLPTESPVATEASVADSLEYPAPELLEPPTQQAVAWRSSLVLKWDYAGELAEDEYYHLHLERRPQTKTQPWWGDYVYLKDTEYVLEKGLLAPFHYSAEHGEAVVYWWVKVVRKTGEDEDGKPLGINLSMPSEERTLVLEPKPEGR